MNYMNTSESSIKIGFELQAERGKADITLREMAVKLGVDNSTISKWETGKNKISAVDLLRYLEVLGIKPDAFFERF